jgi:RNA polymerase sigma-70 factor (ECF subfamily)
VGLLIDRHRERLRQVVELRLDRRLLGRVDPADIVRDTCHKAVEHLSEYLHEPKISAYLWLRQQIAERLAELHREHFGDLGSGTAGELSLYRDSLPAASTAALAAILLGQRPLSGNAAQKIQRVMRVEEGLNALEPLDRELLALRHFEQLSREETAHVLRIDEGTVTRRYVKALKKLNDLLSTTS